MIQGEDKDNLKADLFHFQNIRVVFFFHFGSNHMVLRVNCMVLSRRKVLRVAIVLKASIL